MVDWAKCLKQNIVLLKLDFRKAYDNVVEKPELAIHLKFQNPGIRGVFSGYIPVLAGYLFFKNNCWVGFFFKKFGDHTGYQYQFFFECK